MLNKKGFRLLTQLGIIVILIVISICVLMPCAKLNNNDCAFSLSIGFIVGFIFELLGDTFNGRFTKGHFGGFIRRLLFIILSAISCLACFLVLIVHFQDIQTYNFFANMSIIGLSFVGPGICFAYLIGTSLDWDIKFCPLYILMGYVMGLLFGVILALLALVMPTFISFMAFLLAIGAFIGMIVYIVKVGGAFTGEYYDDRDGSLFSKSSSTNSYSGSSNVGRYNNSYESNASTTSNGNKDNRKTDSYFLNNLSAEMREICDRYSRPIDLLNDGVYVTVRFEILFKQIIFRVDGKHQLYSDKYDNSNEADLKDKFFALKDSIISDAKSAIRSLQSQYTNYDKNYTIDVRMNYRK